MFSLEKLCFNLIVQKFQRFYCAFTESKDENVQRNFQFFQRRFSVQLLTALYVDKKLKEEYFELLINEHVNLLVGKWFKNSQYLTSMEYIFCRLPNLTRICFKNCGDEILKNVAEFCPKIIEIDVRYSKVTDNGVKYLYDMKNGKVSCPELKNLFIKSSLVTDGGAKCLIRNLPSLEKFDYPNLPLLLHAIYKNNVTFIKKILRIEKVHKYNIIELNLSKISSLSYYNDVLKTCLIVCPKLETIACCIRDLKQLDLLINSNLKKLHLLFWLECRIINLSNFLKTNACNLISLKISNPPGIDATNCNISVSLLTVHCPALREFYAHNINFTDDDDDGYQVFFPFLTKCCLSLIDPSCAKAICLILSSAPKLESVSFRFMYKLPLEVKNETLIWCKSASAKLIEFSHIFFEKEFIKDILVVSPYLKAMFVNSCYSDFYGVKSFLHSLSEKQSIRTNIFFKEYDRYMSDMDELHELNFFDHESIFNENISNLEIYLKEEYKCSNIYGFLFPETALDERYLEFHDNWEDNWEVISVKRV